MQINEASFPTSDPRPLDTKAELYGVLVDTRARESAYHHRIRLPLRCHIEALPVRAPNDELPLNTIGYYASKEGPPLTVSVTASILRREVAPADWLGQLITAGGFEILADRWLPGRAGEQADILTRDTAEDGQTFISRWRAIKNGGRRGGTILVVQARTPEPCYPEVAHDAFHSTISLDWVDPGNFPFAENLDTFSRPTPGDFLIYYPASWQRHDLVLPTAKVPLLISDLYNTHGDTTLGRITFIALRGRSSAKELLGMFTKSLAQRACAANMDELLVAPVFGDLENAWSSRGEGHRRINRDGSPAPTDTVPKDVSADSLVVPTPDMSISVKIGKRQDVHYLFGMIGPRREDSETVYAINRRAFDIATGLMRTEPVS